MSGQGGRGGQGGRDGRGTNDGRSEGLIPKHGGYRNLKSFQIAANAALVLIAVACSLLDRQLAAQAQAFEKEGGFTERLYKRRLQARKKR